MLPAVTVPPPGSSWVYDEFAELVRCLERIPDVRKPRGKRHPLAGGLALVVLGLMGECRSLSAIRRFGRCHPEVLSALGLRSVPSVPTLSRVLAGLRAEALRDALRDFTRALAVEREATMGVVAVDGKTLRGVHEGESPAHLPHLFAHESGLVLDQLLVDSVRDEVTAAQRWIETLAQTFPGLRVLSGCLVRRPRPVRHDRGAGVRLSDPAQKNQRTLLSDTVDLFAASGPTSGELATATTIDKGHGRLERRTIRVSTDLVGYSDMPGLAQVAEARSETTTLKTGVIRTQVRYLFTSLTPAQAGPDRLLALSRGHWRIENTLFHVKDDTFGEDRQVLQRRSSGASLCALRNAAVMLLRGRSDLWADAEPMTARRQYVAARPLAILMTPDCL